MKSIVIQLPVLLALTVSAADGQEWARKMFGETHHEFGTVARGAKAEFAFELKNLYKEDIHLAGVRASCGCATPTITKDWIKTWEKSAVLVRYNTGSFEGHRQATITLTIDRPYFAEVQLTINGYIRGDLVLDPGVVSFGSVPQGNPIERSIRVSHAGSPQWKIVDVRSANPHLQVEIKNQARQYGRVDYVLGVKLLADAAPGYITDQMILVTNDSQSQNIPVTVEANIEPQLSVTPVSLFLGIVEPGESVTKQLVVKAKNPFRITGVKCADEHFEFHPTNELKRLHLVPVKFTAGSDPGKIVERIEIETDHGPGAIATCTATATIRSEPVSTSEP